MPTKRSTAKRTGAKRTSAKRTGAKRTSARRVKSRLAFSTEEAFTEAQRTLRDAIASGPRGTFRFSGPFAIWLHAP